MFDLQADPGRPATTIQFHPEDEWWPCTWRPYLPAYGLADWKADVLTGRTAGERAQVRIRSALGLFEGEAYVAAVTVEGTRLVSELRGSGALRLVAPSGGPTGGTP